MSTESTSGSTDGGDRTTPAPPAPDLPTVDGTRKSAGELRAELQHLLAEDERRAAEQQEGTGGTAGRDGARPDTAGADAVARIRAGREGAVARVQQQVERARTVVPEKASTVKHTVQEKASELRTTVPDRASSLRATVQEKAVTARDAAQQKPGVLAAVAAALVLLLLVRRLLKGR